jgi:hypothetical protein
VLFVERPIPIAVRSPRDSQLSADIGKHVRAEEVIANGNDAIPFGSDAQDVAHHRAIVVVVPTDEHRFVAVLASFDSGVWPRSPSSIKSTRRSISRSLNVAKGIQNGR